MFKRLKKYIFILIADFIKSSCISYIKNKENII